jgi:hypothetical protein
MAHTRVKGRLRALAVTDALGIDTGAPAIKGECQHHALGFSLGFAENEISTPETRRCVGSSARLALRDARACRSHRSR